MLIIYVQCILVVNNKYSIKEMFVEDITNIGYLSIHQLNKIRNLKALTYG
jgi:hypothetical protein